MHALLKYQQKLQKVTFYVHPVHTLCRLTVFKPLWTLRPQTIAINSVSSNP